MSASSQDDRLAPVPVAGPKDRASADLFGDFRQLLPIEVEGVRCLVPEGNSVLRALQYCELEHRNLRMEWGRYCWNDTVGCCAMSYRPTPEAELRVGRACQVQVRAGLQIVLLPRGGRLCPRPQEPSR